jgi:hypothetical protein
MRNCRRLQEAPATLAEVVHASGLHVIAYLFAVADRPACGRDPPQSPGEHDRDKPNNVDSPACHCQSSARPVGGQGGLGEFENTGVLSQPMKQPPSLGAKSRIVPVRSGTVRTIT